MRALDSDATSTTGSSALTSRPCKRVSDSLTEVMHMIRHEDINGMNRLFGGRLMEWIDEAAGIAARRHAGGTITTASVDTLQFKRPARLNDIVVIIARVTYVGRTSLEVRVDSYVEDCATSTRMLINSAYLTEVQLGPTGRPATIRYDLEVASEEEQAEWEAAQKRIAVRKQRKAEGF